MTGPWRRLVVPRDNPVTAAGTAQLYTAMAAGAGRRPVQLLLLGRHNDVSIWLRADADRLPVLGALWRAGCPDLELEPGTPQLDAADAGVGARWRLAQEAAYPLRTVSDFDLGDPVALVLSTLAEAQPGEVAALSLVLTPAPPSFQRRSLSLSHALSTGGDTRPGRQRALTAPFDLLVDLLDATLTGLLWPGEPHAIGAGGGGTGGGGTRAGGARAAGGRAVSAGLPAGRAGQLEAVSRTAGPLEAVLRKAAQPAFRVTLRTVWRGPTAARARIGHAGLVSALGQFAVPGQNALVPRPAAVDAVLPEIVTGHAARRERLVLAVDELATLVHVPGAAVVIPGLRRAGARRRATAEPAAAAALHLADGVHRRSGERVGVTVEQLQSHAYVVGPSGTGKTTLLATLALGLVEAGTAGVVLDPHGDLVRQVMLRLPAEHLSRTLLLDLGDPANLPTLNPLWVPPTDSADELVVARAVRSAAVKEVFADVWDLHRATAPNLLHFLEAALAALIAAGGGCLAQLPRFLTDGAYRGRVVRAGGDPRIVARWAEFAAMSHDDRSRTIRSILNKAADFDRNPVLGAVFGDPGPGLRIDEVMDGGRLLLVSLPRGLVPEGTVELIGSLLVSLLYQAALAREDRPAADRAPVVAIIDEFQEFALTTFAKVVTATRKYGLGLVVANQNLSRVRSVSPDALSTLLANAGTVVTFRTAPSDADVLAPLMAPFTADDLVALAPYECYWRLPGRAGPQVVSGRTRELAGAVRTENEVGELARRLRVPGTPLRRPGADAWS